MFIHKIKRETVQANLTPPFSHTTTFDHDTKLHSIYIKFADKYSKTITITYKSSVSSNYDTIILSQKLDHSSFIQLPEVYIPYMDQIKIDLEGGHPSMMYMTLIWEEV